MKLNHPDVRYVKIMLHVTGLVVLCISAWVVRAAAFQPLYEQQCKAEEQTRLYERRLADASKVRQQHAELVTSLAEIQERASAVRRRIPDDSQEGDFLRNLTGAATKEGIEISDYRRGALIQKKVYQQLQVQLTAKGKYQAICGLLDRLAKLQRLSTVQRLIIERKGNREEYSMQLTIALFFGVQREPEKKA